MSDLGKMGFWERDAVDQDRMKRGEKRKYACRTIDLEEDRSVTVGKSEDGEQYMLVFRKRDEITKVCLSVEAYEALGVLMSRPFRESSWEVVSTADAGVTISNPASSDPLP